MESIKVINENNDENTVAQNIPITDNFSIKLHRKCGEIFICDEDIFGFLCTVCESPFEEIEEFFEHVKNIHTNSLCKNELINFEISEDHENNDDQLQSDKNDVHIDSDKESENEKDPLENEINSTEIHKRTFCNLRSESKTMRYHNQILHKTKKMFTCQICNKSFYYQKACEKHVTKHNQFKDKQKLENSEFDEKLSTSDVSAKDYYVDDLIEKQPLENVKNLNRDDLHKCTYCGLRFPSRSKRYHHQFKHKGETPFACKICGRAFRLKYACENHEKKHGSVYKCDLCPATYTSLKSLNAHKRRHSDSHRAYKCNYCDKRFFARGEMISHERSHTGETPFLCIVCGLRFRRRGALLTHVACHSDVRPYKCSQCDKSFNLKDTLKHHIIVHTGERPFKCEICNASFPRKKALKSHEKIHLDKREYVCKICGKGFNQYSGLYSHMKCHGEALTKISNYVDIVKN